MNTKQVQCLLAYLGYYVGTIDGKWGEMSKVACKAFQADFGGLEVDGKAGKNTQKALKHAVAYGMPAKNENSQDFWKGIKYFDRSEFACKCGGKYCNGFPMEPKKTLVQTADKIRAHFGAAATVSSGVRCSRHNIAVGGVANSRHKLGKAMDFSIKGVSGKELLAYAKAQPEIRYAYIIEGDWVHMDID
jgi:hypothetical protein